MKFIKYLLFLIMILFIGAVIYIAVQPNTYEFERSRMINAPASLLFNKVDDFKSWPEFSPWYEQEPEASLTFSEKSKGVNSSYSWTGDLLGEGNMVTTASLPHERITQEINFFKPYEASSTVDWIFKPTPSGTEVTWKMSGKQNFMSKAFTLYSGSIESTVGPQFERGLFKLDSVAQSDMKKYSITVNGITEYGGGFYVYNSSSCKTSDLRSKISTMMPKLKGFVKDNNIANTGSPFVLYHKIDEENGTVMFSCCIPTPARIITTNSDILTGNLNSFKAVKTTLVGSHANLDEAWKQTMSYISKTNLEKVENGTRLESYVTDFEADPNPANFVTQIFTAIKE